jgi:tetratricopeptide (TPR) repeat protein
MQKKHYVSALMFSIALHAAAQIPAGAHSVDDTSRQDAAAAQIREAETSLEQQDYKGAEAKLKALIESSSANAKDGRILYDLGFAEERNNEEADAAKAYAASIAAIPAFAEPRIALGLLDARAGRIEQAHAELLEAAKLQSAAPELRARALRALVHMDETSQPEAAREELIAALRLTPETPNDVLTSAELAERAGDPEDAEKAYRRALTVLPGDIDASVGLAHVLQQQKKLPEADAVLAAAMKDHPNDPRLVADAASLYAAEGKEKEAIPLLEGLRSSDALIANDPKTTHLLAQLYDVSGDDATAEKLYLQILPKDPADPGLLDDIGSAQVKQGKYAQAEAMLSKAATMRDAFHDDAVWGETEGHLAFAASKNHDPNTCLAALAARATVLPNSPSSLFLEATAHDTLRQYKDARTAYKAFLVLAAGKFPDQEFEARHRLVAIENLK